MTIRDQIDNLRLRRARAERIERAYKIEGVQDAVEQTRQKITDQMLQAKIGSEELIQLHAALTGFDMFQHYFISIIADGNAAKAEAEALERQMKGQRNAG